jgi:hypothetical protein
MVRVELNFRELRDRSNQNLVDFLKAELELGFTFARLAGRCIDVSSRRIHVEVSEEIPLHTRVMLRADAISIAGSTSVKYITRCDPTFILVLDARE